MQDDIRSNYHYLQEDIHPGYYHFICTRDSIIQHSIILCTYIAFTYIHGMVLLPFFTSPCSPCCFLLYSLCTPFLLTWRPPAVTGIVLPLLRLLVNWPYLPHPSPNCPTLSNFPEPQLPTPNNDDIGTAPLWLRGTIRNKKLTFLYQVPYI